MKPEQYVPCLVIIAGVLCSCVDAQRKMYQPASASTYRRSNYYTAPEPYYYPAEYSAPTYSAPSAPSPNPPPEPTAPPPEPQRPFIPAPVKRILPALD